MLMFLWVHPTTKISFYVIFAGCAVVKIYKNYIEMLHQWQYQWVEQNGSHC